MSLHGVGRVEVTMPEPEIKALEAVLAPKGFTYGTWETALDETLDQLDVEVEHGDNGIGHYEYWGAKGFDSQPYTEAHGEGDIEATWFCQEFDAPEENATRHGSKSYECGPWRYSEEAGESFPAGEGTVEYDIKVRLSDFKAERCVDIVTVDGHEKRVTYWRMTASWHWEV